MSRISVVFVLLTYCTSFGLAQSSADPQVPRLRMRISAGVMGGLVSHAAVPAYPDDALRSGIQGDVTFKIVVDETGQVVMSEPVEGDPLLVAASVDALREFRFRPYLLNGTAVIVESQVEFRFSLKRREGQGKGQVETTFSVPYRPEFRTGVLNDKGVLILWPHKLSGPEPQLPSELVGKSGSVYLTITIGTDGKVQDVKVLGGDEPFVGPVVAAVKQEVYEAQMVDGKPSVTTTQASYHFGPRK